MVFPFIIFAAVLCALTLVLGGFSGVSAVLFGVLFFVLYFILGLLVHCLILWIMSLSVKDMDSLQERDDPRFRKMTAYTIAFGMKLLNVRVKVEGLEQVPKGRFLLIQNHRSMFDPLISLTVLDKLQLGFITKPENMNIPIIGKFAHRICALPIDRESPRNAVKTINAAADYIKNDVCSIGLYPEGTRNRSDTAPLLPFHNASLKIGTKAGCPVVVTAISGTDEIKRRAPFRRTNVTIRVCGVIPAEAVKASSTAELSVICRRLLCEGMGIPFEEEEKSE